MSPTAWPTTFPFDNSSTRYRGQTAIGLAQAAHLAYEPDLSELERVAKSWGFSSVSCFPPKAKVPEAYLLADAEKIIVAFRGSDSICDWRDNLEFELIGGPLGGKVHEGFDRLLNPLWRDIQREITTLKAAASTDKRSLALWFTGHSRGAALATLAVGKLREKDNTVHGLYTFGSPRVGDRDFARHFDADMGQRTFRMVNDDDLVTRMPPRSLGYSHVGQLYYLDESGKLHTDPGYWYRFLDSQTFKLEDFFDLNLLSIKPHDIARYMAAILQNQSRQLV
jgi:triacylglycerol lipase